MKHIATGLTMIAAFLFIVAHGNRPSPQTDRPLETSPGKEKERTGALAALEFWTAARAYPGHDIPPGKYSQAADQARRMMKHAPRTPDAGGGWKWIGPSNLTGRMISLACNPQNGNTVWAGSASGGLWRSRTGGLAGDWQRISTGAPVLGVGAIAIHPSDSNTIYIGTGEVYRYQGAFGGLVIRTTRGSYGVGILKSTDGGATWTKSLDWSYNEERGIHVIRINPLNPATVWAGTTDGIYKTTDGGATWTNMLPVHLVEDIVIHPVDTGRVLASLGNFGHGTGLFKTWDGGTNWSNVTFTSKTGKLLMEPYAGNPEVVYASVADSVVDGGPNGELWRTTDFGTNWTFVSLHSIVGVQGWYSHYVAVHPNDSTQIVHGGVTIGKSTNGGSTFTGSGGGYSDHHAYAHDLGNPDILYDANDGGVFRSTNFGATFTNVSAGLNTGQLYNGFSNSGTDSLFALGQAQDHIPGWLYTGSLTWGGGGTDEAGWTAIDPSNDNYLFAVSRWGGSVRRSTNRGASWTTSASFGSFGAWNSPIVVAPSAPSVLYFADGRVFRTSDHASTWVATNGSAPLDGNECLSLAVAPTDANIVYTGTVPGPGSRGHIFRTTDGGTTWADVTGSLPDRYPLDIAVDPGNVQTVYTAFGGYNAGHLFRSTNGGSSWSNITGSLPDIPVTAILLDPLLPGVMYIGTDLGVHLSTNGGSTWYTFNDGLPEAVLVSDLTMTPSNRTMRVTTHGSGVWQRRMPAQFPSLALDTPDGGEVWEAGSVHPIEWSQALVPAVRIELTTDGGATWKSISDSVGGNQSSYAWTVPLGQTSTARIRVTSRIDTTLRDESSSPFTIFFNGTVTEYRSSWNMISLPIDTPDHSLAAIFPAATGGAFSYDGSYHLDDSLLIGRGYWVKLPLGGPFGFAGTAVTAESVAVSQGWNLVGTIAADVAAASLQTQPPGLLSGIVYGFDGSYTPADILHGGQGYWVRATGAGMLIIPGADQEPKVAAQAMPEDVLRLSDRQGRSQNLYLVHDPAAAASPRAFLPPAPPAGAFDIRFAGDRLMIQAEEGRSVSLELQGAEYPVRIEWNTAASGGGAWLAGNGLLLELSGSGSSSIRREQAQDLRIRFGPAGEAGVPRTAALLQNYPNPFNPATVIRYVLPAPARASLRVYAVSGELVTTLAEGPAAAGPHEIRWDASSLPSGVYFYRLEAGDLSIVRKMLLTK